MVGASTLADAGLGWSAWANPTQANAARVAIAVKPFLSMVMPSKRETRGNEPLTSSSVPRRHLVRWHAITIFYFTAVNYLVNYFDQARSVVRNAHCIAACSLASRLC